MSKIIFFVTVCILTFASQARAADTLSITVKNWLCDVRWESNTSGSGHDTLPLWDHETLSTWKYVIDSTFQNGDTTILKFLKGIKNGNVIYYGEATVVFDHDQDLFRKIAVAISPPYSNFNLVAFDLPAVQTPTTAASSLDNFPNNLIDLTFYRENRFNQSGGRFSYHYFTSLPADQQTDSTTFTLSLTSKLVATVLASTIKPVKAYPNPATTTLFFQASEQDRSLTIFDALGRTVLTRTDLSAGIVEINIADLAPGIYWISNGIKTAKFLKH